MANFGTKGITRTPATPPAGKALKGRDTIFCNTTMAMPPLDDRSPVRVSQTPDEAARWKMGMLGQGPKHDSMTVRSTRPIRED